MRKKMTVVISGPSGVGKGTIVNEVLRRLSDVGVSISSTTRAPRPRQDGTLEEHGKEYFFLTHEQFEQRIGEQGFLEHAYVHGNYYGTSREYVQKLMDEGKDVILEIEMQGAMQVRADNPQTVSIFILPPQKDELRARLVGRGSETPEAVEKRMKDAAGQMALAYSYDYVVMNDDLETAVADVIGIIHAERLRTHRNKALVDSINKTFQEVK